MKSDPGTAFNFTIEFIKIIIRFDWKRLLLYTLTAFTLITGITLGGCATNPATGEIQLQLYSEAQEIEIGKKSDEDIVGSLGLYNDKDLKKYIEKLGLELAAESERPHLPWTFRLVDDPAVNAFALPGGYIYVTRGILTYLNNEAELVGVIGHEIGHVTAKHSVQQMSTQQLIQFGFGLGRAILPKLEGLRRLAGMGLGLMMLQFSREDENQADELGLRYMVRTEYDPRQLASVMTMLDGVTQAGNGGRVPVWLSTHPDPGNRRERILRRVDAMDAGSMGTTINRYEFLDQVDGMVFGPNPREGFFKENRFYHPDLKFFFEFPRDWETSNLKQAVVGVSPDQYAVIQIMITDKKTIKEAADEFFGQEGLSAEQPKIGKTNGMPEISGVFTVPTQRVVLQGFAAFIAYKKNTYQILGYTTEEKWPEFEPAITASTRSFNRLTDKKALSVKPMRLKIVTLDKETTLEDFADRFPSPVSIETLALINHVGRNERLHAGMKLKLVVGKKIQ